MSILSFLKSDESDSKIDHVRSPRGFYGGGSRRMKAPYVLDD
jgi:hypothetical protein